jgi:NADH dehydrogenase FAD-containing subunit
MKIAIIGGGYAGFDLARRLDAHADVTLIEARDAFVHNVAAIRAVAQPDLLARIVIPYDRLLKRGRTLRGRATAIDASGVSLADGSRIAVDAIVVATGSHYAAPFKPQSDTAADFADAVRAVAAQVAAAEQIVIVGAGAVGVELAGEIKAVHPGKAVALVSNQPRLFPSYPETLHQKLVERLLARGVALHLGQAASGLARTDAPHDGEIALADGTRLTGLIVPAIGARITTSPAHALPDVQAQPNGQLAVDGWLRPSSLANVFVLGDLAATGEGMTVVAATRQSPWLARALRAMASGKPITSLPAYASWRVPPILVPLGPKLGASVLPLGKGLVVGDRLTAAIKGKSLFIPRYHKEFDTGG